MATNKLTKAELAALVGTLEDSLSEARAQNEDMTARMIILTKECQSLKNEVSVLRSAAAIEEKQKQALVSRLKSYQSAISSVGDEIFKPNVPERNPNIDPDRFLGVSIFTLGILVVTVLIAAVYGGYK